MKRGIALTMAALVLFSGCSKKDDSMVENYKNIANEYVSQGNVEKAIDFLKEGYAKTDDESLLAMAQGMEATKNATKVETPPATQPASQTVTQPAEAPEPSTEIKESNNYTPVALNKAETEKLNIFLSNFTETFFGKYDVNDFDKSQLVSYAFLHNKINDNQVIVYTKDGRMGISAQEVQETSRRFFGKSFSDGACDGWQYENGYYYAPAADGESYSYFALISNVQKDNTTGCYLVDYAEFWNPDDYELPMSKCYSFTIAEARQYCDYLRDGTAVVREKEYNGKVVYELLSYNY